VVKMTMISGVKLDLAVVVEAGGGDLVGFLYP
jgi:hypothetical protein